MSKLIGWKENSVPSRIEVGFLFKILKKKVSSYLQLFSVLSQFLENFNYLCNTEIWLLPFPLKLGCSVCSGPKYLSRLLFANICGCSYFIF